MKTINWKRTDWTARKFLFLFGQEVIGQLTFNSSWSFNAVYTDEETKLMFTQKSFWNSDVLIMKEGKAIGEIHSGLFGEQTLKLVTGEKFFISTNFWAQDFFWKTDKGETVVSYRQALMSAMEKGLISLNSTLTIETEKLLICSGLFIKRSIQRRRVLTMVTLIPIFAAAIRL